MLKMLGNVNIYNLFLLKMTKTNILNTTNNRNNNIVIILYEKQCKSMPM